MLCVAAGMICLALLPSCSSKKYLQEGDHLLTDVRVRSDSAHVNVSSLSGYVRQHPNQRWFSAVKVPLGIYLMSNPKSSSAFQNFIRRMGEAPVVYDSLLSIRSQQNIQDAMRNMGYLHARVDRVETIKGHKIKVKYLVHPGVRYYVDSIDTEFEDTSLIERVREIEHETLLRKGMAFDANVLNRERSRIMSHLQNCGYYKFNRDFINFVVDTLGSPRDVHLKMIIQKYRDNEHREPVSHPLYTIGTVRFTYDRANGNKLWIRENVLNNSHSLFEGELYREKNVADTYSRLNRMGAIAATNVHLAENAEDSTVLDAQIKITPARLNSIQLSLDGTNTAGDLGAAVQLTYQNRNVFHGSELFSIKFRTAFEAIRNLHGYENQNFFEYNIEAGLTFPDFKFPFLSRAFRRRAQAFSELSIAFDSQNRPEFHRRVLTTSWKYRWGRGGGRHTHRVDLFDLNYVFMPWISETFYEKYIANPESRNAIIAYNYQNLFILRLGYKYKYSSVGVATPAGIYGKDAYTLSLNLETAGNLLDLICSLANTRTDEYGHHKLFNVAYAQYAKFDFDVSKSVRISRRSSLAFHFGLGIAYPYGNSDILPYEKRYFSGGANSVRGWSVRELGPGKFIGTDGQIDFINQTGDLKLDMNVELRTHLFWKLDGALFIDAGNIWTLRDYKDQPGGQFNWSTCWEQIAVAYGLGLRLNFNYFILRFDGGMKAINPAFDDSERHYPLIHPNFKRDFTFHFAVGLPF